MGSFEIFNLEQILVTR